MCWDTFGRCPTGRATTVPAQPEKRIPITTGGNVAACTLRLTCVSCYSNAGDNSERDAQPIHVPLQLDYVSPLSNYYVSAIERLLVITSTASYYIAKCQ